MTGELINKSTGNLVFSDSFILTQQTKPEELISYFGQEKFTITDIKNGWKQYSIRNVKIGGNYFLFTFFYNNDLLRSISFILNDKVIVVESWDSWSEEEELRKKNYYEAWLTHEIGKTREFSWGAISANYDSKSGGSSIFLRYS